MRTARLHPAKAVAFSACQLTLALALAVGAATSGCRASLQDVADGMSTGLNATAFGVDPLYEAATVVCNGAEQLIVARTGTTAEEDAQALEDVRAKCDPTFAAFELARVAHQSARTAVELFQLEPTVENLAAAEAALLELTAAAVRAEEIWRTQKAELQ